MRFAVCQRWLRHQWRPDPLANGTGGPRGTYPQLLIRQGQMTTAIFRELGYEFSCRTPAVEQTFQWEYSRSRSGCCKLSKLPANAVSSHDALNDRNREGVSRYPKSADDPWDVSSETNFPFKSVF